MASVPASPVESLRTSLEEDRKRAAERWGEADKALSRLLRDKKKEASQQEPPRRPLPLQRRSPPREERALAERSLADRGAAEPGCGTSSWLGSGSEEDAEALAARASRVSAARDGAFEERARQMRRRADDSRLQSEEHERRKLRAKVAEVLLEVKRRQELLQTQEKARQHREAVLREGGRASLASLGEASGRALGLPRAAQKLREEKASGPRHCEAARAAGVHAFVVAEAPVKRGARNQQQNKGPVAPPPGPSPRRVAIVESLTLEELDLLRRNALFFFDGPVLAALCSSTLEADVRAQIAEVRSALEPLADFFTPARDEKDLPVSAYARKLRSQLQLKEEQAPASPGASTASGGGGRSGSLESLQAPSSWDPSDRMPSQGRRPACREDHRSPTLAKVREVYLKRDAADAKWVAEREEAMVRREAINAFKANEQQREWQLEIFKQKELHKVRMLEAEERKAMLDSEQQERTERFEASKADRLRRAEEKADDAVEDRREKATLTLDVWKNGVMRCERHLRDRERMAIERAETKWGNYMARLWALGMEKHDTTQESQCRKNDMLKAKIQSSLHAQLRERQLSGSASLAEVLKKKQAAAAERRERVKSTQYRFLEKAFGSEAARYDGKYHWGTTDRRSESWKKSSEAWGTQSRTFSEPSLTTSR